MGRTPEVTLPVSYLLNPWWGTLALAVGAIAVAVLLGVCKSESRSMARSYPVSTITTSTPLPSSTEVYVPPTERGAIPTVPDTLLFSRKHEGRTKDDLREAWYRVYREVGPPPTVDAVPIVTPQGVCSWRNEP